MRVTLLVAAIAATASGDARAQSSTVGKIQLTGRVPARAAFSLADSSGSPLPRVLALDAAGITAVHVSRSANTRAGYVITLATPSAERGSPSLAAADGSRVPYRVRFRGRELLFVNGAARLAIAANARNENSSGDWLEIVTPRDLAPRSFHDRLTLTVTAR